MTQPTRDAAAREAHQRDDLLRDAAARGARYLTQLETRSVAPTPAGIERLAALGGPLPDTSTDAAEVLTLLDDAGSPATLGMAGPRYFGFVIGGSLPAALAANWLAGAWDQNAAFVAASPVGAKLEEIALAWMVETLGLPAGTEAGFTTGATMANFTALAAARHAVLQRAGWDIEGQGLFGAPPVTVVVGDEVHSSLVKALGMVGFGRERVVRVPVDDQGRMRADAFPQALEGVSGPLVVCVQAGNVNTGAFDPMTEIIPQAHAAGAWVHVDGAFGLWAAAAPTRAHLAAGMSEADSWATDGHKWLNVPYDSGIAFVRDAEPLRAAMSVSAAYLPMGETREPSQYTPEMSRRARGVEVWAALRALGRAGLAEMIDRCCRHASRFAEGLRAGGYEVLNDVTLNQVLVSFGEPEATRRVIAGIQADGTCWCGGTIWQGRTAMRISVSSWATSEADVEQSLDAMLRVAREKA